MAVALARVSGLLMELSKNDPAPLTEASLPSLLTTAASGEEPPYSAQELRAALDSLAKAMACPPPAEEPCGERSWVTYFSEDETSAIGAAWYPSLRCLSPQGLAGLWGAAQFLGLPECNLAPFALEAAQRAHNWPEAVLSEAFGERSVTGSLHAAAARAHISIVEPLLVLLTRRGVDASILHGDGDCNHYQTSSLDDREWVSCDCESTLRALMGSLGKATLPDRLTAQIIDGSNLLENEEWGAWVITVAARGLADRCECLPWLVALGRRATAKVVLAAQPHVLTKQESCESIAKVAALSGSIKRMRWVAEFAGFDFTDASFCSAPAAVAARAGYEPLFQWLTPDVPEGLVWGSDAWQEWEELWKVWSSNGGVLQEAFLGGHIPIIEWLYEAHTATYSNGRDDFVHLLMGYNTPVIFNEGAEVENGGTFEGGPIHYLPAPGVVRWAINHGLEEFFTNDFIVALADVGDLDGLKALYTNDVGAITYNYNALPTLVTQAVRAGRLHVLEWLHAAGVAVWDIRTVLAACASYTAKGSDSTATLTWLFAHGFPALTPKDQATVCCSSAYTMTREKLQFFHQRAYSWDERVFESICKYWSTCDNSDRIDMLEFAVKNGCPRGTIVQQAALCERVTHGGNAVEALRILCDADFALDSRAIKSAVSFKAHDALAFLLEKNAPRGTVAEQRATCAAAAAKSLQALQLLRGAAPPFDWDRSTCFEPIVDPMETSERCALRVWLKSHSCPCRGSLHPQDVFEPPAKRARKDES